MNFVFNKHLYSIKQTVNKIKQFQYSGEIQLRLEGGRENCIIIYNTMYSVMQECSIIVHKTLNSTILQTNCVENYFTTVFTTHP